MRRAPGAALSIVICRSSEIELRSAPPPAGTRASLDMLRLASTTPISAPSGLQAGAAVLPSGNPAISSSSETSGRSPCPLLLSSASTTHSR